MEYQITQLSCFAEQRLQNLSAGTVHSVYRRTINFTVGGNLLSLQAKGSPLSPISLISSLTPGDMDKLKIKAGDCLLLKENSLEFQNDLLPCRFRYADAQKYNLKLSNPLNSQSCKALASNIKNVLSTTNAGGFSLLFKNQNDLSLILSAAKSYILRSSQLCSLQNYREAALELSRLVGLGIGLTPSGDDFLCGVLAGLCFSGNTQHPFRHYLIEEIRRRLLDTIDISAAFLSCALENTFSLPVNGLCQIPPPEEILAAFEAIGHSSGMDTLCGILWSLEHLK